MQFLVLVFLKLSWDLVRLEPGLVELFAAL